MSALIELSVLLGRVLMECFTAWWSEHPSTVDDHGFLFARNATEALVRSVHDAAPFWRDVGLRADADISTLAAAFFYSDASSHYYLSENLGKTKTFLEWWDIIDRELTINCRDPNRQLCKIRNWLLYGNKTNFVEDFRVTENLFLAQYFGSGSYIPRNVYYTDHYIDETSRTQSPHRTLNYPTMPQFKRVIVDKGLNEIEESWQRYGLNIWDNVTHDENNSIEIVNVPNISYEMGIFADTFYYTKSGGGRALGGKFLNVNEVAASNDSFMIWPSMPKDNNFNRPMLLADMQTTDQHLDFYPYSRQPFNLSSVVRASGNSSGYNVSDRYYRISEEKERGGFADFYRTVWIFSNLDSAHDKIFALAQNLTDFALCLDTASYADCRDRYLPWYRECSKEEDEDVEICREIADNFRSLDIDTGKGAERLRKALLWSWIAMGLCCLMSLVVLFLFIFILCKLRGGPGSVLGPSPQSLLSNASSV